MRPSTYCLAALACAIVGAASSPAADLPDLSKLDRAIRKEPGYTAKRPLYTLAVFGPKAEKCAWLVLDSSEPDAASYDVLHIDRNADGDLTGLGERLTRQADGRFHVGTFKDPATGAEHTDFTIRGDDEKHTVMLSLRWRGEYKFGGGYPEDPEAGYMTAAPSPKEAPVAWVQGDAPFRFQRWYGGRLAIGGADDFKVFLGQPGRGPSTFCAAQQHFLPAGEVVRATLIYRDGMGKEQRAVCELKERC
jgi:hypothetical protein